MAFGEQTATIQLYRHLPIDLFNSWEGRHDEAKIRIRESMITLLKEEPAMN